MTLWVCANIKVPQIQWAFLKNDHFLSASSRVIGLLLHKFVGRSIDFGRLIAFGDKTLTGVDNLVSLNLQWPLFWLAEEIGMQRTQRENHSLMQASKTNYICAKDTDLLVSLLHILCLRSCERNKAYFYNFRLWYFIVATLAKSFKPQLSSAVGHMEKCAYCVCVCGGEGSHIPKQL